MPEKILGSIIDNSYCASPVGSRTGSPDFLKESNMQRKASTHEQFAFLSRCLPEFIPIKKSQSKILDAAGMKLLTCQLPPLTRMREWNMLFTLVRDGTSFSTFYEKVNDRDNVLLVVEDTEGGVFGAFTVEEWHRSNQFYGCGADMFLFKLGRIQRNARGENIWETDNLETFEPTFLNNKYQYSDSRSLTIGSSPDGQSSLYLSDNFATGISSGESETFDSPVLSSQKHFTVK